MMMKFEKFPNSDSGKIRTAARGFSLIELLVAIGIIALLVAIGVGVGMKVSGQGKIKATKANMLLIMNAIETFHDENDAYPGAESSPPSSQDLYTQLTANDSAKAKLSALPADAIAEFGPSGSEYNAFADKYGNEISYSNNAGLGGTPVLISAGSDGEFGTVTPSGSSDYYKADGSTWGTTAADIAEREEAAEDDIRSDK